MMKWIIFSFLTLIFWVGLYLYLHLGFSEPVEVSTATFPQVTLVFKEHLGAYHKINSTIEEVEKILSQKGLQCSTTFGEYHDNPNEVAEDRLKSIGGCLFFKSGEQIKQVLLDQDLKLETRPQRRVVMARFKGSPSIGPMKVYPKIDEQIQTQRLVKAGPMLEIYEIQGDRVTTTFVQAIHD